MHDASSTLQSTNIIIIIVIILEYYNNEMTFPYYIYFNGTGMQVVMSGVMLNAQTTRNKKIV